LVRDAVDLGQTAESKNQHEKTPGRFERLPGSVAMPTFNVPNLETARRFATALDAEDYESVPACLAADCVYHSPGGVLIGPDAIVKSYRDNGAAARMRFERVEFESLVETVGLAEAVITFVDRVRLSGRWHLFRCQQYVRVDVGGLVNEIRHEELPGERERLREFEAEAGRVCRSGDVPRRDSAGKDIASGP
jgi:hypothetical protein